MNEKEIMDIENRYLANVFTKRPVVLTRGKGALVWDINGKEYVDCSTSYGVALLGHCHPKVVAANSSSSRATNHMSRLLLQR